MTGALEFISHSDKSYGKKTLTNPNTLIWSSIGKFRNGKFSDSGSWTAELEMSESFWIIPIIATGVLDEGIERIRGVCVCKKGRGKKGEGQRG